MTSTDREQKPASDAADGLNSLQAALIRARYHGLTLLHGLAVMAPMLVLSVFILGIKNNIPVLDDFNAVLLFMADYAETEGFVDRIRLMFEPYGDHRIVFTRLFAIFDATLFGEVNFVRLTLYALAGLGVCILAVIAIAALDTGWRRDGTAPSIAMTLIVALLVARPEDWKHLHYAMANIQAIWAVAFALMAIALAPSRGGRLVTITALFAALTVLTSSSGVVLLAILAILHFVQRRYVLTAGYLSAALGAYLCFAPSGEGGEILSAILQSPWESLRFALGVGGATVDSIFLRSPLAAPALGLFVFAAFSAFILTPPFDKHLRVKAAMLFLGATAALIGLGRGELYADSWTSLVLDGRYRIVSVISIALLAALGLRFIEERANHAAGRSAATAGISAALLTCLMSYNHHLPGYRHHSEGMTRGVQLYFEAGNPATLPAGRQADTALDRAVETGVWSHGRGADH